MSRATSAVARELKRDQPTPAHAGRHSTALCLTIVVVATVLPFLRAIHNEFVDWDDYQVLVRNEHLRSFTAANLSWMLTTGHMANWQPLGWLAAAFEYRLFGPDVASFSHGMHATSIALHAVAAALAFLLVRRVLALHGVADTAGFPSALNLGALAATLFFSMHPLRVEVVAWATAQPYILALIWTLASVLCYLNWCQTARRRWLALAWLSFALSLLCKPIAVPLVVILPLLDRVPSHAAGSAARRRSTRRSRWLDKLPFAVLSAGAVVMAALVKEHADSTMSLSVHGPVQRLAQACHGLVFYVAKTVLPYGLSPLYELRLPLELAAPRYVFSALAVLGVAGVLLVFRARLRDLNLVVASYVILLAPVLGFLQSGNQEVADRYSYLPCLVWSILLAGVLARLLTQQQSRLVSRRAGVTATPPAPSPRRALFLAPGTVALLGLAVLTWHQVGYWANTSALWTRAVTMQPDSSLAQNSFGYVLLQAGRTDEAIEHFRRAIAIRPANDPAHFNLWTALERQGRVDELAAALRTGAETLTDRPEPRAKLANLYFRRHEYDAALPWYESALALRPDDAEARAGLAGALYALGEREKAIAQARRALESNPNCTAARLNLALALRASNQPEQAAAQLGELLRIDPENVRARELLARWTEKP
jgi:Flp pilus assembly protein TadD